MLQEGKIITVDRENYIVLSVISYEDGTYAFAAKLNEHYEPMEEHFIWKESLQKLELVKDEAFINRLLPIFQKEIREKILKGDVDLWK